MTPSDYIEVRDPNTLSMRALRIYEQKGDQDQSEKSEEMPRQSHTSAFSDPPS